MSSVLDTDATVERSRHGAGARHPEHDVELHEFAHKLDLLDGSADSDLTNMAR